jgi:hypothetical protein
LKTELVPLAKIPLPRMRAILTFVCLTVFTTSYSQYYFNDIVSMQTGNEHYKSLRTQKIKKIKASSFEADNSPTEGFLLEEDISMDGKKIVLTTALSGGKQSTTTRTYELSKLKRIQAFSNNIETRTDYFYDAKGLVQKIQFTTTDTAMKYISTEVHEWLYNETGQPVSMLKIKNKTDSTSIEFVKDEKGLIVEEKWKKKARTLETYYYYYDAGNHLTDIVRFNNRLRKLIPDFQYEYDTNGRMSQMTQFSISSASYIIWKYTYNDKGLKLSEEGFDKEKKLVGRIVYSYE